MQRLLLFLLTLALLATAPADARKRVSRDTYGQNREVEDAIYLESVRQRLAGHRDAAFELLTECLRLNPNSQEALYDLANLKLQGSVLLDSIGNAEGDSLLRRAYAVDTTNTDIRERLARHLLSRSAFEEATKLYELICAERQPDYNDLGILIQLYVFQAKYSQALATLQRLELLEGPDAMSGWQRYDIMLCMGEEERALQIYDSLLVKAMPDPETPAFVRDNLRSRPQYNTKVNSLHEQILKAIEEEDFPNIIKLCHEGEIYEPDLLAHYFYEASAYRLTGQSEKALEVCTRSFNYIAPESKDPVAASLYAFTGDLYTEVGNIEAALEAYEYALKIDSTNVLTLNNMAYQLSQVGRELERAERMSRYTIEKEPENSTYLDTYAWILHALGREKEARLYIDRAIRHADDIDEELRTHRDAIYKSTKRKR